MAKLLRLERLLASRGGAELSRSKAAIYIKQGRVRVNGATVKAPSKRVPETSSLELDGAPLEAPAPPPLLAAYHKPLGVLSTVGDPYGRPSLLEHFFGRAQDARQEKMHPVGRLDADTTGLLLFSSSGSLTQRLLHPRSGVPRTYVALVAGDYTMIRQKQQPEEQRNRGDKRVEEEKGGESSNECASASLAAVLEAGVPTSDGVFPARLLSARRLSSEEVLQAAKVVAAAAKDASLETDSRVPTVGGSGDEKKKSSQEPTARLPDAVAGRRRAVAAILSAAEGVVSAEEAGAPARKLPVEEDRGLNQNRPSAVSEVVLEVSEGKYRMVRRILANIGLPVLALHRTRYGLVTLEGTVPNAGDVCMDLPDALNEWASGFIASEDQRASSKKGGPRGAARRRKERRTESKEDQGPGL